MATSNGTAPAMEYRTLGKTGLKVSVLGYGAWVSFSSQVDVELAKKIISRCWDAGVNFFDNAEVYAGGEAEKIMGQALRELGYPRDEYVLTTKVYFGHEKDSKPKPTARGLSRKHIIEGVKGSLERFGMDYVDVVFCHRPDPETPMEETVRAMNWVLDKGYAFYWGTSEWSAQQIEEAWQVADKLGLIGPCCEQPQYNLLHRQRVEEEYAPVYEKYGTGLTVWSPLASGILTGKYSGGQIPEGSRLKLDNYSHMSKRLTEKKYELEIVDQLKPVADELGCSLAQLALAWCAHNPHVSVVLMGASKLDQLESNLGAIEVLPKLTKEVVERIEGIVKSGEAKAPKEA